MSNVNVEVLSYLDPGKVINELFTDGKLTGILKPNLNLIADRDHHQICAFFQKILV